MITSGDVLRFLVAALMADAPLVAWCRQAMGRPPLIQVGSDPSDDPRQWRLPAIVLLPQQEESGQARAAQRLGVVIELRARSDKTTAGATGDDDPVLRQYDGVYLVDEFARHVRRVIETRLATTRICLDAELTTVTETEQLFPIVIGELRLTLNLPAIIGAESTLE